jgi:hypothetical protein
MEQQDRQAIEGLFAKLRDVERSAGPREGGADAFIRENVSRQPNAPYFMAQTIVVQEQALEQAQRRIEELEYRSAEQRPAGGGFLSGIFGGGQSQAPRGGSVPQAPRGAPWQNGAPQQGMMQQPMMQQGRGGGFLAGAAQTAMGVAGGVLLGNAIGGMFGGSGGAAQAAEPAGDNESASDEGDSGGGLFDDILGGGDDES